MKRAELLAVANSDEFAHLPPSQIVPRLADQQRYIASESTFYRVLREANQLAHRRSERPTRARSKTARSLRRRAEPAVFLGHYLPYAQPA